MENLLPHTKNSQFSILNSQFFFVPLHPVRDEYTGISKAIRLLAAALGTGADDREIFGSVDFPRRSFGLFGPHGVRQPGYQVSISAPLYPAGCRGGRLFLPRPDADAGRCRCALLPQQLPPCHQVCPARCGQRNPAHRSPRTPLHPHLSPLTSHLSPLTSYLSPLHRHLPGGRGRAGGVEADARLPHTDAGARPDHRCCRHHQDPS